MDLIDCTVRLNCKGDLGKMEIVRTGPDALTPAECIVIQNIHDTGSGADADRVIRNARVVGSVERSRPQEIERLTHIYGIARVRHLFPANHLLPMTLEDIELPGECVAPVARKRDTDASLRAEIEKAGGIVPDGKLSLDDLRAIRDEVMAAV